MGKDISGNGYGYEYGWDIILNDLKNLRYESNFTFLLKFEIPHVLAEIRKDIYTYIFLHIYIFVYILYSIYPHSPCSLIR